MQDQKIEKNINNGFKKSVKVILTMFFVIFILSLTFFLFYYKWILNTPASSQEIKKIFEVKKGETTFDIASKLQDRNLIKSDWIFFINAKIKAKDLQVGVYELSTATSMNEIYDTVSNGKTAIVKVTIPEGYRNEQIAQVLADKKITKYDDFMVQAKGYEGTLFPDTYYFSPDYTAKQIVQAMNANYNSRIEGLTVSKEDLIIASIVEREASLDEERPLIAGVYKNRIKIGMKLEADPTVQYARDNEDIASLDGVSALEYKFWKSITLSDYRKHASPYNMYLNSGLPPAPICNPGIKSIRATINYSQHKYLYFLQHDGVIYPAETLDEHNANRAKVFGS